MDLGSLHSIKKEKIILKGGFNSTIAKAKKHALSELTNNCKEKPEIGSFDA